MKRWLFAPVAVLSLLLSVTAAGAWALSYTQGPEWHLLGMAHSPDLNRVNANRGTSIVMTPVDRAKPARYGYWDALWARSRSGSLTLVAHRIDYDGYLREVSVSPPSLIVEVSGPARVRAVAFGRSPDSRPRARQLGFAWDSDAQQTVDEKRDGGGSVSVGARMIMLPYWFIVSLGVTPSLLWLRVNRRPRRGSAGVRGYNG